MGVWRQGRCAREGLARRHARRGRTAAFVFFRARIQGCNAGRIKAAIGYRWSPVCCSSTRAWRIALYLDISLAWAVLWRYQGRVHNPATRVFGTGFSAYVPHQQEPLVLILFFNSLAPESRFPTYANTILPSADQYPATIEAFKLCDPDRGMAFFEYIQDSKRQPPALFQGGHVEASSSSTYWAQCKI